MKININGETYEATAHSVTYPNDLLNGVLLDMPDNYAFLSEHVDEHRDIIEDLDEVEFYDLTETDVDYDTAPHSWVVKSVVKLMIQTAESWLD